MRALRSFPSRIRGWAVKKVRSITFWIELVAFLVLSGEAYSLIYFDERFSFLQGDYTVPIILVLAFVITSMAGSLLRAFFAWMAEQKWSPLRQCPFGHRVPITYGSDLDGVKGPGFFWVWPHQRVGQPVDVRLRIISLPTDSSSDKNNVAVSAESSVSMEITDLDSLLRKLSTNSFRPQGNEGKRPQVYADPDFAVKRIAEAAVRKAMGNHGYEEFRHDRNTLAAEALTYLTEDTPDWGIKFHQIYFGDILPTDPSIQELMSIRVQEERRREARVVAAQSETDLMQSLVEIARSHGVNDPEKAFEHALSMRMMMGMRENGGNQATVLSVGGDGGIIPLASRKTTRRPAPEASPETGETTGAPNIPA